MELEVVSTHPRAFLVDRFLSDYETDQIIQLAKPTMGESRVGTLHWSTIFLFYYEI